MGNADFSKLNFVLKAGEHPVTLNYGAFITHVLDFAILAFVVFLMVKAGEVQPLVRALENHQDLEVRLTAITLSATSGHPDTIAVFRRVAVRASLPSEVRSAAMEGLHQITANAQLEIE
jgi:hypothetical protein